MRIAKLIIVLCIAISLTSLIPLKSAHAGFFVRPKIGYAIPITGGDGAVTLGGALGYSFGLFSVDTGYTRYMRGSGSVDSNLWDVNGTFGIPLPIITPYVTGGGGIYWTDIPSVGTQKEGLITLGAGAFFNFIPIIDVGIGLNYQILFDSKDMFYPTLYLGLSI